MTMPRHIQTALINDGVIDEQRVSAKPTLRRCRRCGSQILAALTDGSARVPGPRQDCDPRPLTPLGELQALAAGLDTFTHGGVVARWLTWREPAQITARPADTWDVHAEHRCDAPPLTHRPATRRVRPTPPVHPIPF